MGPLRGFTAIRSEMERHSFRYDEDGRWLGDRCRFAAMQNRERKVRTPQGSVPDNVRDRSVKAPGTASATETIPPRRQRCGKGEKVR